MLTQTVEHAEVHRVEFKTQLAANQDLKTVGHVQLQAGYALHDPQHVLELPRPSSPNTGTLRNASLRNASLRNAGTMAKKCRPLGKNKAVKANVYLIVRVCCVAPSTQMP